MEVNSHSYFATKKIIQGGKYKMATIQQTVFENIWKHFKATIVKNNNNKRRRRTSRYVLVDLSKTRNRAIINRMLYGF